MANLPSNSEVGEGDIVEIAGSNGPIRMKVVLLSESGPTPGEPEYHGLYLERVSGSRTLRVLLSAAKLLRVVERATPAPQPNTDLPKTYPTGGEDSQPEAQPEDEVMLFQGGLSGDWYVATKWHTEGEHFVADKKYRITKQLESYAATVTQTKFTGTSS